MTGKRQKIVWIGSCLLALGIWAAPARSVCASGNSFHMDKLEKILLSPAVQTVQYRHGKIKSKKNKYWKKAVSLPLTASKLMIPKKGWYTVRVISSSDGKKKTKKLYRLKLKKKTYAIAANTPVRQKIRPVLSHTEKRQERSRRSAGRFCAGTGEYDSRQKRKRRIFCLEAGTGGREKIPAQKREQQSLSGTGRGKGKKRGRLCPEKIFGGGYNPAV